MHAVIRTYSGSGAKELFDALDARKSDVENLMTQIDGFKGYLMVRTRDGGTTVTICESKTGCDESVKRARDWVATHAPDTSVDQPVLSEGPVIANFRA